MVIVKEKIQQKENFIKLPFSAEIAVLEILKNSKASILSRNMPDVAKFIHEALDEGVPLMVTRITSSRAYDIGEIAGMNAQHNIFIGSMENPLYKFALGALKIYQITFGSGSGWFLMFGRFDALYIRDY